MDTKVFPNVAGFFGRPQTHSRLEDMRKSSDESLAALGAKCVDLWYLHGPDRSVPLEETAKAINTLLKEGRFKRWGVSNFMAWEGMQPHYSFEPPKSNKTPLLIERDSGSTLRDMHEKRLSATECIPRRIQRPPPHNRTRTTALPPPLQHVLLRFQPLGRRLADIAVQARHPGQHH
jgi:hypothetical protein